MRNLNELNNHQSSQQLSSRFIRVLFEMVDDIANLDKPSLLHYVNPRHLEFGGAWTKSHVYTKRKQYRESGDSEAGMFVS